MTTSHTNTVTITGCDETGYQITGMEYVRNSFVITTGQPSGTPAALSDPNDPNVWTITVDCGRQASSEVATGFNDATGSGYHQLAWSDGAEQPDALNFYFAIKIAFSLVPEQVTIYLGQGSIGHLLNNWWIGGPSILNSSPGTSPAAFLMADSDHLYQVSFGTTKDGTTIDNAFVLSLGPPNWQDDVILRLTGLSPLPPQGS